MLRISSNKGVEAVEYVGYCDVVKEYLELTGIRTWKLYTGKTVIFYHGRIQCSCSGECNSMQGGC